MPVLTDTAKWLQIPKPDTNAKYRLFCFPYSGAGASVYQFWPPLLPEVEVCAIQLPGRESRRLETPLTAVGDVILPVLNEIAPYLDKPFALFGHSLGALIAFELARHLHDEGSVIPLHLFVAAKRAPHMPDPAPPIHELPDREFVEGLCERYNGIPKEVLQEEDLMQMLLPALRADLTMNETYVYSNGTRLDCPITACGGLQDVSSSRNALEGWRLQTTGLFKLHMFPGDHFFLKTARVPLLRLVADELQASVEQVA